MSLRAPAPRVAALEYELLLEGVYRQYGYDFRRYAKPALFARLRAFAARERAPSFTRLLDKVLHKPDCFARMLDAVTAAERKLFDDPEFFQTLRLEAVPLLRSYPSAKVWCVGCANGDALALAVIAHESGLHRTRIYATDASDAAVNEAARGVLTAAELARAESAYRAAGGQGRLAEAFTVRNGRARLKPAIRARLVFAAHNVTTDAGFNEFELIVCRGVLPAFSEPLQRHVHGVLFESLARFGLLGLARGEPLAPSAHARSFEPIHDEVPLFRKVTA